MCLVTRNWLPLLVPSKRDHPHSLLDLCVVPRGPVPSLDSMQALALPEPLRQALQEIREELQGWRSAVEQRVEEALGSVRPLAAAICKLREENAALWVEHERLSRNMARLVLYQGDEKDPSEPLLESKDPCANFVGTEEPREPVAHPPTFSSTRRMHSAVHLSRSGSFVSPPVAGSTIGFPREE